MSLRTYVGNEQEVSTILSDVIAEFGYQDKSFTAYDVTIEARKYTDIEFFHADVVGEIHRQIRSQLPNYGVRQHASYNSREYYSTTPTVSAVAPVLPSNGGTANLGNTVPSTVTTNVNVVATKLTPRSEGRVLIPALFVKRAGGSPSNFIVVESAKKGELVLVPGHLSSNFASNKKYCIDSHSNIRLTKRTLSKANLANKNVTVLGFTDKIVVSE